MATCTIDDGPISSKRPTNQNEPPSVSGFFSFVSRKESIHATQNA
ncbi:hypothetical protein [Franconibacter helveticus]|nr:hypothetical protein [Franconibacter helveticus]MDU6924011.1 hypothetical protein [Franconibacter helveticus]